MTRTLKSVTEILPSSFHKTSIYATAAKSLQSSPTLCDPIDGSPPGSPIPVILQARILEWAAISFSNACVHGKSLQSCLTLCNPIDGSPPGSSVHRILEARILEWAAIPFSPSIYDLGQKSILGRPFFPNFNSYKVSPSIHTDTHKTELFSKSNRKRPLIYQFLKEETGKICESPAPRTTPKYYRYIATLYIKEFHCGYKMNTI